jgi:hypothetical protein
MFFVSRIPTLAVVRNTVARAPRHTPGKPDNNKCLSQLGCFSAPIHFFGRLTTAVLVFVGLLLVSPGTVLAGDERPVVTSAFPNAPGMITLAWSHVATGCSGLSWSSSRPILSGLLTQVSAYGR